MVRSKFLSTIEAAVKARRTDDERKQAAANARCQQHERQRFAAEQLAGKIREGAFDKLRQVAGILGGEAFAVRLGECVALRGVPEPLRIGVQASPNGVRLRATWGAHDAERVCTSVSSATSWIEGAIESAVRGVAPERKPTDGRSTRSAAR